MRHTKIIATVGPASDSDRMIDDLIAAGTDIVRLNFSHGTQQWHGATYARVREAARRGDRLLLADGLIELRVEDSDGVEIRTIVVEGGRLGEHKGINAPGVPLPASAITPKDADDLRFGLSLGVDMVAVSFVQTAADLRNARQLMADVNAADVPLVAKLE